jgi:hypothetical protein
LFHFGQAGISYSWGLLITADYYWPEQEAESDPHIPTFGMQTALPT